MVERLNIDRARMLRRDSTDVERRIWMYLRNRGVADCKFVRQMPIGPFIADFACREKKLIVELDGGQHVEHANADAARTRYLESQGYRVLRFWNNDVLENLEGVLELVAQALVEAPPHPLASLAPSPRWGEGRKRRDGTPSPQRGEGWGEGAPQSAKTSKGSR